MCYTVHRLDTNVTNRKLIITNGDRKMNTTRSNAKRVSTISACTKQMIDVSREAIENLISEHEKIGIIQTLRDIQRAFVKNGIK